jgi:hypothetical protein
VKGKKTHSRHGGHGGKARENRFESQDGIIGAHLRTKLVFASGVAFLGIASVSSASSVARVFIDAVRTSTHAKAG